MEKKNKITIAIICIVAVIIIGLLIYFLVFNNSKTKTTKVLDDMSFNFELDNIIDSNNTYIDDLDRNINMSDGIKGEFFIDETVGIYDISIYGDNENSVIEYTIKNHGKNKREAFKYRLKLVSDFGEIYDYVDLDSQEMPDLSIYRVKINIKGNIVGVYSISPTTNFEEYGTLTWRNSYEKM